MRFGRHHQSSRQQFAEDLPRLKDVPGEQALPVLEPLAKLRLQICEVKAGKLLGLRESGKVGLDLGPSPLSALDLGQE
jgi:hypothetical protein